MKLRAKETLWFYLLVSPWLVGFIGLTLGPMLYSFYLGFTDWDLFNAPRWVGLDNFVRLFTQDRIFGKALLNTFYYAGLSIPLGLTASLAVAWLLNKPLAGMRIFRTLYYIPALVPAVATSLIFQRLLAPNSGLNQLLALVGIQGPAWLLDPLWVKPALVLMSLWGVGGGTVLLLAGMQGVPVEFYEAAAMDGANQTQMFFKITLPMLSPVLFFNLITGLIGAMQTFTQVYIMTGGGPNNASLMIVPYLFDNAFRFYHMGYASAIAWVLFVLILLLTLLVFRSSSAWVYYESEVKR
ncbi:MAG: sugar ABC transporter permease [Anaerolinea sp.]|nr:sugar ABC transporter permease [Anaerolinea sp.]